MIGSSDTVVEDLYAEIGPADRGAATTRNWWTCLARDLPFAGW
jgi:hypothetical protein